MKAGSLLVLLVLGCGVVPLIHAKNVTLTLFQDSDHCRMETIDSVATYVQATELDGACHALRQAGALPSSEPKYYMLTVDEKAEKISGNVFCKRSDCTECGATLKKVPLQQCFAVDNVFLNSAPHGSEQDGNAGHVLRTPEFAYSATVQSSDTACLGPGDVRPSSIEELLMFQYRSSRSCSLGGNATLTIQNMGRPDGVCRKPSMSKFYQRVDRRDKRLTLYLDCPDATCQNCLSTTIQHKKPGECGGYRGGKYELQFQGDLQACATYAKHKSRSETGAIAGGIIGALIVALIILMIVTRMRSAPANYEEI